MPFDNLEYVVRPYTTPNAHGSIIIPSAPREPSERATLTWNGAFTLPDRVETSDGVAFDVVCCQEALNENSRKSETKRITQQDNDGNWVDVERPYYMELKKKESNKCGDDWNQISWVSQEINSALAEFDADLHTGVASGSKSCSTAWNFVNK